MRDVLELEKIVSDPRIPEINQQGKEAAKSNPLFTLSWCPVESLITRNYMISVFSHPTEQEVIDCFDRALYLSGYKAHAESCPFPLLTPEHFDMHIGNYMKIEKEVQLIVYNSMHCLLHQHFYRGEINKSDIIPFFTENPSKIIKQHHRILRHHFDFEDEKERESFYSELINSS